MEHFRFKYGDMFSKCSSWDLSRLRNKQLAEAIDKFSDEYILNVNEQEFLQYLIEEYSLYMPVVHFENVRIEPRKVLVDVDNLPRYWGADSPVERNMIRYIVPFSGDRNLLYVHPSVIFSSGSGNFHVGIDVIYTDILALHDDSEMLKRDFESAKDSCSKMLNKLESELQDYNKSLPCKVRNLFANRKEKIKKDNSFIANLGMPTSSQIETPKTYAVPTVSHRFGLPKAETTVNKVNPVTPVMDMAKYEQILESIHIVGQTFEKLPKVTKGMDEETLRDLFLAQIQTSFQSDSATAETFNKSGKTDIILKNRDCILFVAECKFWKGKQVFHDAISQLLSYLTWRDTKAALLIFVRNSTMTTAVNGVKENVSSHENYKCSLAHKGETWFNYKFTMPNDKERGVYLAIQIFDFNEK